MRAIKQVNGYRANTSNRGANFISSRYCIPNVIERVAYWSVLVSSYKTTSTLGWLNVQAKDRLTLVLCRARTKGLACWIANGQKVSSFAFGTLRWSWIRWITRESKSLAHLDSAVPNTLVTVRVTNCSKRSYLMVKSYHHNSYSTCQLKYGRWRFQRSQLDIWACIH